MPKLIFSAFLMVMMFSSAHAESGKKDTLDWPNPKEELVYHSCGCADACWVADLQDKASGASKIKLSCDCEDMHLEINGEWRRYKGQCKDFENENKFERIVGEILEIEVKARKTDSTFLELINPF